MILLDTHIWIWWVNLNNKLSSAQKEIVLKHESEEIGISIISCWEVARLVEYKRLEFACSIKEWIQIALDYPGVTLLNLTPDIVIESSQLPSDFHKDPADQMIAATARILQCILVTADKKIINYEYITTVK